MGNLMWKIRVVMDFPYQWLIFFKIKFSVKIIISQILMRCILILWEHVQWNMKRKFHSTAQQFTISGPEKSWNWEVANGLWRNELLDKVAQYNACKLWCDHYAIVLTTSLTSQRKMMFAWNGSLIHHKYSRCNAKTLISLIHSVN